MDTSNEENSLMLKNYHKAPVPCWASSLFCVWINNCGEMYRAVLPRGVTKTYRKIAAMVLATKIVVSFISRYVTAEI